VHFESKYEPYETYEPDETHEPFGNAGPVAVSAPKKSMPINANQVIRRHARRIECVRKLSKL